MSDLIAHRADAAFDKMEPEFAKMVNRADFAPQLEKLFQYCGWARDSELKDVTSGTKIYGDGHVNPIRTFVYAADTNQFAKGQCYFSVAVAPSAHCCARRLLRDLSWVLRPCISSASCPIGMSLVPTAAPAAHLAVKPVQNRSKGKGDRCSRRAASCRRDRLHVNSPQSYATSWNYDFRRTMMPASTRATPVSRASELPSFRKKTPNEYAETASRPRTTM